MIKNFWDSSWNPLKITATDLPPNLLLMAKIIVIGLLLKDYPQGLPEIFLPFVPAFDLFFVHGYKFQKIMEAGFWLGCLMILFNRRVKWACLMLSAVIFTGILANRFYYSNNIVYVAVVLFWVGLHHKGERHRFLEWQIALMYFGAGLNKVLEPDWISGQYMDYWLGGLVGQPFYLFWSAFLPGKMMAQFIGWSVFAAELALSVLFLKRSWQYSGVWLGVLLHSGALLLSGFDFQIYTIAILASYLAFFRFPKNAVIAGGSPWVRNLFLFLEKDKILQWDGASGRGQLKVGIDNKIYRGFSAFRMLLWLSPWHYFLLTALMCVPSPEFRSALVMAGLVFYAFPGNKWLDKQALN